MGIFILIIIALYFLPAIIGALRHKRNKGAIFALNFFLGWTMIGWVVALVWALMKDGVLVVTQSENSPVN